MSNTSRVETNSVFGGALGKISPNLLLDSSESKGFSEDFIQLYKDACNSSDNYTLCDDRMQERMDN